MKKSQILTLGICVAGGVLLLLAFFALYSSVRRFGEVNRGLKSARRQLDSYYKADVFPSEANVQRERENTRQLEVWFDELMIVLREGNVTSAERSPSRFLGVFERARERLLQQAQAADTVLPPPPHQFPFGFERYTGTGTLPNPDDVPRLTEQLMLITRICRILFENRIKALHLVQREVFEDSAARSVVEAESSGRRESAMRRGAVVTSRTDRERIATPERKPGLTPEGGLFGRYRFVLSFDATEEALVNILNALALHPTFSVVVSVTTAKEIPTLIPESQARDKAPDATVGVQALFGQPGEDPPPQDAPAMRLGPNHPVSGIDMEIPMRVRLELDIYNFKEGGS